MSERTKMLCSVGYRVCVLALLAWIGYRLTRPMDVGRVPFPISVEEVRR